MEGQNYGCHGGFCVVLRMICELPVCWLAHQHTGLPQLKPSHEFRFSFFVWFPGKATLAQNPSVWLAFPCSCSLFQLWRPSQASVIIWQVSSNKCQHTLTAVRQSGILFPALSSEGDDNVPTLVAAGQKKKALNNSLNNMSDITVAYWNCLIYNWKTKWHW